MIVDVVMPKMGESITEGTIIEWRKKVGDVIALDEILLEIGTDKVDSEIPSPNPGILVEVLAEPNDVLDVGAVIARIETDADSTQTIMSTSNKEEFAAEPIIRKPVETPSDIPLERPLERLLERPLERQIGKSKTKRQPTKTKNVEENLRISVP